MSCPQHIICPVFCGNSSLGYPNLFLATPPLRDLHPKPWSVKRYENRHSGVEYIVIDNEGACVAEATDRRVAEAIAAGQPADALLKPEEPLGIRIARLQEELNIATAKKKAQDEKAANEAYQLKLGEQAKKCSGTDAGPDHIWLCDEIRVTTHTEHSMFMGQSRNGQYHCKCGARMTLES